MNNYTLNEWAKMQNDAERRVRNTRDYAKNIVNNTQNNQKPVLPSVKGKQKGILSFLNFDNIEINKDTSTILMLLALLGKEGGQDDLLMLALLYIMM